MKAIALLSGGLDSTLAVRLILEQGIEVEALKFTSPFCRCDHGGGCAAAAVAKELNIPLVMKSKGPDYLEIVKNPKYGYGRGINPCIDCRIYMLRYAKAHAEATGAAFIFTGEVLGQRPMSQHLRALGIIEREAGLEGKLLRPLSAHCLPETEAERSGLVDRKKLLSITGRSRRAQLDLARDFGIQGFSCPAGGCLLTDERFAKKMRDLFAHREETGLTDMLLLTMGRHFRYRSGKVIVGRNEIENERLRDMLRPNDLLFEALECMGPTVVLQESIDDKMIAFAAGLTAAYADTRERRITIRCVAEGIESLVTVSVLDKQEYREYLLC